MSARHQSIQPPTLHIRTLDGHVRLSHPDFLIEVDAIAVTD